MTLKMHVNSIGIIAGIVGALVSVPAHACDEGRKRVVSCATTTSKFVEVCSGTTDLTYTFGRVGQKPELRLAQEKSKVLYASDSGTSAEMRRLTFNNGATTYTLEFTNFFARIDENGEAGEEPPSEATLEVRTRGKLLATLHCDANSIEADFSSLDNDSTR